MIDVTMLNENQQKAVLDESEYLRIIAGAGSGKTRVLTMRIVHLILDKGVNPKKILAITFTNKAADEMKQRIGTALPAGSPLPFVSTIHSICLRILREDIDSLGWPRNFSVLDAEDQKQILKEAYKELDIDKREISYAGMLNYISVKKAKDQTAQQCKDSANPYSDEVLKAQVYDYYLKRQKELWSLDFDDLILYTVKMFHSQPAVRGKWQRHFSHIHVDEFQDVDKNQYAFIRYLTGDGNSLYVVGDPDQTIYTWRGADVSVIMNLTKDYPQTKTITLNQNYRSTSCILKGANAVIKNNKNRIKKDLFTTRTNEEKITHYLAVDDEKEALWIANEVQRLHEKGIAYQDMALLYRSNYLSRSLEKGFMDTRIPYVIYGGVRFYERQEIKDALAYLKLVVMGDDLSLKRVINQPKRGIGSKTITTLEDCARKNHVSMLQAIREYSVFSSKTQNALNAFAGFIEKYREDKEHYEIYELLEKLIEDSGLKECYQRNDEQERIENLQELVAAAKDFSKNNPGADLEEYLQLVALYGDRENNVSSEAVKLMTVHAAKGLEFDTVFVTDMNEGIFPNERALNEMNQKGLEEERRLAYVAFTRAKNKLYITEAGGYSYILQRYRNTSRFIMEIDEDCIEHVEENPSRNFQSFSQTPIRFEEFPEEPSDGKTRFKRGDEVTHNKFGDGIVIGVNGIFATIAFSYPYGVKKIAMEHPSLSRKE